MDKELSTRDVSMKVPPSLFEAFRKAAANEYKTISVKIRELMVEFVKSQGGK